MRHQFRRHRAPPATAFKQVVEFFGRPPESVWSAIRNRERDDVENDGAYVDGIVGELVNVDLLRDTDLVGQQRREMAFEEKMNYTDDLEDMYTDADDNEEPDGEYNQRLSQGELVSVFPFPF